MNIIICDDNIDTLDNIKKYINVETQIPNINVFTYDSSKKLIEDIKDNKIFPIDLILLDIELGDDNGIAVASEIQFINSSIKIIFITGYESRYSQHIFKNVVPSGFITKPIKREVLSSYINQIYLSSQEMHRIITLRNKLGEYSMSANEISYVESYRRSLIFHLKNDEYTFSKKLDDIIDLFPPCFVRCHKSYLVNLNAVAKMETTQFVLIDGSTVNISKSMRENTRKAYFKYKGIDFI